MSKILLQKTIAANPDDWDIARFSLLADELRAAGHDVVARNRTEGSGDDPVLSHVDYLGYDQLWLMAVDTGDGLTDAETQAIVIFRERGVLAAIANATVVARGRSSATGRRFNLALVLDGERASDGRPMGRVVAESTFHHFADYNWDLDLGAPSFVNYVRNIATWLQPNVEWMNPEAEERFTRKRRT